VNYEVGSTRVEGRFYGRVKKGGGDSVGHGVMLFLKEEEVVEIFVKSKELEGSKEVGKRRTEGSAVQTEQVLGLKAMAGGPGRHHSKLKAPIQIPFLPSSGERDVSGRQRCSPIQMDTWKGTGCLKGISRTIEGFLKGRG